MANYQLYLVRCVCCGRNTSKQYARANGGRCKGCVEGTTRTRNADQPTRNERILESGYQAYAREEGHYDQGDY